MATITVAPTDDVAPRGPLSARFSTPQVWGFVLLAPYVLVFIAFVLYPVGYWLVGGCAALRCQTVALFRGPRDKRVVWDIPRESLEGGD